MDKTTKNFCWMHLFQEPTLSLQKNTLCIACTAWKVSVFGVILVRIFPHSDQIRTRIILNTGTFYTALRNKIQHSTKKGCKNNNCCFYLSLSSILKFSASSWIVSDPAMIRTLCSICLAKIQIGYLKNWI